MSDVAQYLEAAEDGDTEAVDRWLAEGMPVDARDGTGRTAIWCATRKNRAATVSLLLERGADAQAHFKEIRVKIWESVDVPAEIPTGPVTLLHEAANVDAVEVAMVLAEGGFALDARTPEGLTPLAVAAFSSAVGVVDLLLEQGVDADALDGLGFAPLDYAKSVPLIEKLLDAGASPDGHVATGSVRSFYRRPLLFRTDDLEALRLLLDRGADPAKSPGCVTWHAHFGRDDLVEALLAAGAAADDQLRDASALAEAAAFAHQSLVERLLKAGATSLDLALFCACGRSLMSLEPDRTDRRESRLSILRRLLGAGADPNASGPRAPRDRTVHVAAERGDAEILELLIEAGAGVDATNEDERTPLHLAALEGHGEAVECLLKAGADAQAKDKKGKTPFALARGVRSASLRVLPLLRKAGGAPEPIAPARPAAAVPSPSAEWEEGVQVTHVKFGAGIVESVEGTGDTARVTVRFVDGARKILARFLKNT